MVHEMRKKVLDKLLGPFERAVSLPPDVEIDRERLRATYKDGFLWIILPKITEPQARTVRNIEITE